jgi:hypothetical protein
MILSKAEDSMNRSTGYMHKAMAIGGQAVHEARENDGIPRGRDVPRNPDGTVDLARYGAAVAKAMGACCADPKQYAIDYLRGRC